MAVIDPYPDPYLEKNRAALAVLDDFFYRIDRDALFTDEDPETLLELRERVLSALRHLLVRGRSFLETNRELNWPYQALADRKDRFVSRILRSEREWVRDAAFRFLARLPFPGQWEWLYQAEQRLANDPEFSELFGEEQRKVARKIEKKRQKQFQLRHFCQILKRPRLPKEKGILRIFSLYYLFTDPGLLDEISRDYLLYVEPATGVLYRHTWLRVFSRLSDPCLFGLGGVGDSAFIGSQPNILTTPLSHGDFLEADETPEPDGAKRWDVIFNGTFDEMERKRHDLFLWALKQPAMAGTTALILGRGNDENVAAFQKQAAEAGLSDRVTVVANLRRDEVYDLLPRCRVGVHLALYENGCRATYEYFRADVPCVASTCMGGMNPAIFNSMTGKAVPDRNLPEAIAEVLRNREGYRPREWFLNHSGSQHSSRELNQQVKAIFTKLGYDWTEDIVPLGSSGATRYVDKAHYERFRPQFEDLLKPFLSRPHLPVASFID
jgi:hypothetical protein